MNLLPILQQNAEEIRSQWLESVFRTYPLDTTGFMRKNVDIFANPVGTRTAEAIRVLTKALLQEGLDSEVAAPAVDDMIRIRCVQDFTPTQAVGVIFLLKGIVRKILKKDLETPSIAAELLHFESKIDTLALMAFDVYTKCNALVYKARVKELKKSNAMLFRKAGLFSEKPAEEPDKQ